MLLWTTKDNNIVHPKDMDNSYLASIIRLLKQVAVVKRETIAATYENMASFSGGIAKAHFLQMHDEVRAKDWEDFADDIIFDLIYEAASRRLVWDTHMNSETMGTVDINGPHRGTLERSIVGVLRDTINKHGPITKENAPSGAKRVIGAIKDHNRKLICRKQACAS